MSKSYVAGRAYADGALYLHWVRHGCGIERFSKSCCEGGLEIMEGLDGQFQTILSTHREEELN